MSDINDDPRAELRKELKESSRVARWTVRLGAYAPKFFTLTAAENYLYEHCEFDGDWELWSPEGELYASGAMNRD